MISSKENQKIENNLKSFPNNFYWGSATASYQVEGGIFNTDWATFAEEGKVPICDGSTDHYNRFESDFDLAKSLGHNAHRFSIEWARIEPEEGEFKMEEIEHYREVIKGLKARGIEPFITIWHFTQPVWFAEKGGFKNKKSPEIFARYARFVIENLGNEARFWITMNEPLVFASNGYLKGVWPPFELSVSNFLKVFSNLAKAHCRSYELIKEYNPKAEVGIAKHNIYFSSNNNPLNILLAKISKWFWNRRFINLIRNHQDFIGLNYYFYKRYGGNGILPKNDMGWDIFPEGIYYCLKELSQYEKPLYITENGLADGQDILRAEFITNSLKYVHRAISEGIDVRGYLYWSLLDNYEWMHGFTQRFGLVSVDYETLERTIRPSAYVYKSIIEKNAV